MATASGHSGQHEHGMTCPDPSAHEKPTQQKKLQDQAAGAALYVTHPERKTNGRDINPLGPDGKLSSAGAAASLKYARAQDLPSFPSVGIQSESAGKAALLANNYKMAPLWQPEGSAAGSKAALLAQNVQAKEYWKPAGTSSDGLKAANLAQNVQAKEYWKPTGTSSDGLKAANLATGHRKSNPVPALDSGYTDDGHEKALLAARMSVRGRKRADSTPSVPANSTSALGRSSSSSGALKAANAANSNQRFSQANEQSRLTHAKNLSREMYTEHPPVGIETSEKAHQDALRASAVSMAKKLYDVQHVDDDGKITLHAGQAARSADKNSADTKQDVRQQAIQYLNLQEAAEKLAAERLKKIDDQHEANAFRDYYGYGSQKRKSRVGKGHERAASDVSDRAPSRGATDLSSKRDSTGRRNWDVDSDDEEQAAKVRNQMSQFNARLAEVDNSKRDRDRQSVLAAAERKVAAQMSQMDQKIFNDTGKMSPAMMEDWDSKARAKAVASSQARNKNQGKVDIGGGKFLDQSEIDAIAAARIKPTLDQINETAEKQRARDEEIRLDRAETKRQALKEKEQEAEAKALQKRTRADEKEAERLKKRDEKEQTRVAKHNAEEDRQRAEESAIPASPEKKKNRWSRMIHGSTPTPKQDRKETDATEAPTTTRPTSEPHTADRQVTELTTTGLFLGDSTDTTLETGSHHADELAPEVHVPESAPITPVASRSSAPTSSEVAPSSKVSAPEPEEGKVEKEEAERGRKREPLPTFTSESKPNRMSKLLSKFSRSGKKEQTDGSESGFAGGAKLTKEKHVEPASATTAAAGTSEKRSHSPVSSLSSSDVETGAPAITKEPPSPVEATGTSSTGAEVSPKNMSNFKSEGTKDISEDDDDDDDDDFEEARDRFETADLVPPPNLLSRKTESPVRDSRFKEAL